MATAQQSKLPAVAVLCSGNGSNLQAILDACRTRKLKARVAAVLSDNATARALERARSAGVPSIHIDRSAFPSREAYDQALVDALKPYRPSLVCLAGYMRIVSKVFLQAFPNRVINIHPALLPAFPGAHGVRDALAWGAKVTGVTVHLVDEKVDHGAILLQEPVRIEEGESEAHLLKRVHAVEHELYPRAIGLMLERKVRWVGRRAIVRETKRTKR